VINLPIVKKCMLCISVYKIMTMQGSAIQQSAENQYQQAKIFF
jgi:hypothetical protein